VARRSGFRHRDRSRRVKTWGFGPDAIDQTLNSTSSVIWTDGIATTIGELTLLRTRGQISVTQNVGSAIQDGFAGAHGICMVTLPAFTAGVGSVPSPITESDWDGWIWHEFWDVRVLTATIADGVNAVSVVHRSVIDSKAMRKGFDDQMRIIGVTEVVEGGTASVELHGDTRMLFLQ